MSQGFKLDPVSFTEMMRSWVLEDKWQRALDLLIRDLQGIQYEQAISVLKGDNRFVAVPEGLDLAVEAKDISEEYKKKVDYLYAGRWYNPSRNHTYRPYAVVTSFGRQDLPPLGASGRGSDSRSLYYADDSEKDVCFAIEARTKRPGEAFDVLFCEVRPSPPWLKNPLSPQEALDRFHEEGRYLEERGAIKNREGEEYVEALAPMTGTLPDADGAIQKKVKNTERRMIDRVSPALEAEIIAASGLSDEELEAVQRIHSGEIDKESIPEPDFTMESKSGYILPSGVFYACEFMEHRMLAKRIVKHVFNMKNVKDPEIVMDEKNSIRIQRSLEDPKKIEFIFTAKRITKKQQAAVWAYCEKHGISFPKHIEEGVSFNI